MYALMPAVIKGCLSICPTLPCRYVDCDVVVAEVRETSRKPDEMYALLERLSPGTRKLEVSLIRGRHHVCHFFKHVIGQWM
jgi:N6-adenosine-specific RNA methylase IME4